MKATLLLCCSVLFMTGMHAQNVYPSDKRLEHSLLELPAVSNGEDIIVHEGFTVGYDSGTLLPDWVAYELTESEVDGTVPRSDNFGMDPDYGFKRRQAMREDYSRSGWDKGHMAPAADMKWSAKAMTESFYLTNICPQNHTLNEDSWLVLEKKARAVAKKYGRVWIICGPVITDNRYGTIGEREVCIPDAFFKAFLVQDGGGYHSIAFLYANEARHQTMKETAMTVNQLEELIGKDLYCNLSRGIQESVEEELDFKIWSIR